jgi:hypothetical protein
LFDGLLTPSRFDWEPRIADVVVRARFGTDDVSIVWLLRDQPPPGWSVWPPAAAGHGCLALTTEQQLGGATGVVLTTSPANVFPALNDEVERTLKVATTKLWRDADFPDDAAAGRREQAAQDLEGRLRRRLQRAPRPSR